MFIYENHLGGVYSEDIELYFDELYCEQCGDSDFLIGFASTREEAWELLKDVTNTFDPSICESCDHSKDYDYCSCMCKAYQHSGGYDYEYIQEFINENWPK